MKEQPTYTFPSYEGPIELLWHLIQKNEMNIYEVPIQELINQFMQEWNQKPIEMGADFIATAATLVWYKSKMLLPSHEGTGEFHEEEDPHFEIIHHLVEYCRFKQAAQSLTEREMHQSGYYFRGTETTLESKKTLGIEHLSLQDLAILFKTLAAKAASQKGFLKEEEWKVSDKIQLVRTLLNQKYDLLFEELFQLSQTRAEIIVTFLAVLELMKMGEIQVIKKMTTNQIYIQPYGQRTESL